MLKVFSFTRRGMLVRQLLSKLVASHRPTRLVWAIVVSSFFMSESGRREEPAMMRVVLSFIE